MPEAGRDSIIMNLPPRSLTSRYDSVDDNELLLMARKVRDNAYAPYSAFRVGAALLSEDGRVFTGVNVENASIGLSVCAERNAVARAIAEGATRFSKLAIVTDAPEEPTMPCGACRQVLWEFERDLPILIESDGGAVVRTNISELFQYPFTSYS